MTALRKQYEQYGIKGYYSQQGANYRNPHEFAIEILLNMIVEEWPINTDHVLDLACGSGEVTLALHKVGITHIDGIDPYTYEAYKKRTHQEAERMSFEAIAVGSLLGRKYSLIICSFALHLVETSKLPSVLFQLSLIAPQLLILTPHKRPVIAASMGWNLAKDIEISRIKARLYNSQQSST